MVYNNSSRTFFSPSLKVSPIKKFFKKIFFTKIESYNVSEKKFLKTVSDRSRTKNGLDKSNQNVTSPQHIDSEGELP
jgi:hypothetical protein